MLRPIINNSSVKASPGNNNKKMDISLKNGTMIKATVTQKLRDGDFIIVSGDKNIRAHSAVSLKEGQSYDFIVLSAKNKIELKVLGENNMVEGNRQGMLSPVNNLGQRITQALSAALNFQSIKNFPNHISGLIARLHDLLNYPISAKNISEVLTWVKRNIQGSGIFWETKVLHLLTGKKGDMPKDMTDMDLKGILLRLLKSLEKSHDDHEGIKTMTVKIREALSLIEQEQVMNINSLREGFGWFVHLPIIDNDDFLSSDLMIKEDSEGIFHFSLFLDMRFSGKMDIDVSVIKETARIRMDVENEKTKNVILENINELEKVFRDMGLKTRKIHCEVKEIPIFPENMKKGIESSVDLII